MLPADCLQERSPYLPQILLSISTDIVVVSVFADILEFDKARRSRPSCQILLSISTLKIFTHLFMFATTISFVIYFVSLLSILPPILYNTHLEGVTNFKHILIGSQVISFCFNPEYLAFLSGQTNPLNSLFSSCSCNHRCTSDSPWKLPF